MENDRIIRKAELFRMLGVKDTTVWRWERDGLFPKRIHLSPGSVGWLESEIQAWLSKKASERK